MNIILNPYYILKPDQGRVLFFEKESVRIDPNGGDEGYNSFIHPVFAIILNCMDGSDINKSILEATEILNLDKKLVFNFVNKLINNNERLELDYDGVKYVFPKKCFITTNEEIVKRKKIDLEELVYEELDLRNIRHYTPTDITLMVNTICATDCFYCYADRRVKTNCKVPFNRVKELIKEAFSFNARSFNVIGGEFFLYKQWKDLLLELKKYNFSPYISTKVPIDEKDIRDLNEIGIIDLQISLDTLISINLMDILKVKEDYFDKIKNTLLTLEKYKIKVVIHTIVNSKNDNLEDFKSVYEFIKKLSNIKTWRIDLAESSLYHSNDFEIFKPNKEKLDALYNFVKEIKDVQVNYDSIKPKQKKDFSVTERLNDFKNRSVCSANYSHLFILPDGQVTGCEEFYWHPNFLIGNVLNQSLLEIWNSDQSKHLALIPQKEIPAESPCSTCNDYIECRSFEQICFRDTMKAYGKEKWYYPDVRCPKSILTEEKLRV